MSKDLSKLCADFLRAKYPSLKAGHAHEIVAAFFGYKSHASLLAESMFSLDALEQADIVIPDVPMIEMRRERLEGLSALDESLKLAEDLVEFLELHRVINGEVWLTENLDNFMMEEYLPENVTLDNELAAELASTNAIFEDEYYESAQIKAEVERLLITVKGVFSGETHPDKPFAGDQIDFVIDVDLARVAGRIGFHEPEINTSGSKRDYRDYEDDLDDDDDSATVEINPDLMRPTPITFGKIRMLQYGNAVEMLQSTPASVADQNGWRPQSLRNLQIELDVFRGGDISKRAFGVLNCKIRFPEQDRLSEYPSAYDMRPGVERFSAKVVIPFLPMNFEKFQDTYIDVVFDKGAEPLAQSRFLVSVATIAPTK